MIVWLASYPRSGNTFFRVLLNHAFGLKTYSIYDDKYDIGSDEKTAKVVGHEFLPEGFSIDEARDAAELYVVKTHGKPTKDMANDKVIYLIRDGRESTVSFQRYLNNFAKKNVSIDDVIIGDVLFDSWGEHVKAWNPQERENTLSIKFEELISSPVKYIDRISKFLDVNPIGDAIPSFEELKAINPIFFSSGRVDAWKDVLNDEQLSFFEIINFRVLHQFGYSCVLDDSFETVFDLLEKYQTKIIKEKNVRIDLLSGVLKENGIPVDDITNELNTRKYLEFEKKLAARNQDCLELDKQLTTSNQEYLELDKQLTTLNQEYLDLDKHLTTRNQEYLELDKQLTTINQEYLELEKQLESRTIEHKKLTDRFKQLEGSKRVRLINKLMWPIDAIKILKS